MSDTVEPLTRAIRRVHNMALVHPEGTLEADMKFHGDVHVSGLSLVWDRSSAQHATIVGGAGGNASSVLRSEPGRNGDPKS
eukprot:4948107-Pyramimonas_sp.AAC.1